MADTKRSVSDLLTNLFQDGQGALSISAQDLRDLIVSMHAPHGSTGQVSNATETVISVIGTYVNLAGTFVPGGAPEDVTEAATCKLTYTGTPPRRFHLVSNFSFTVASNNQLIAFSWFKNGTKIGVPIHRKVGTGTDEGAVSIHTDTTAVNGDYFEVRVANDTSTANVTVDDAYIYGTGKMV